MDGDAERLEGLLDGDLGPDEEEALQTQLERRPALRRRLADLALERDRTRPDPGLRVRAAAPHRPRVAGVQVGPTLGIGGMAVVRLGQQLKLDRPVAVKTLREGRQSTEDMQRLLHEARITGRLEHPNIVPVHDIVHGPEGLPRVVLKLIEGDTWSRLIDNAERVQEEHGADDLLEWNLQVLMTVARALSFAHSRGILHRDVKPANVMLGAFGEVYLVDWGIALDLDSPDADVDEGEVSGTTAFMSPEQLEADLRLLGPWTDTYLLGAVLFQVVTGSPPHVGKSLEARVGEMLEGIEAVPPIPPDVPAELRTLLERTLEPDPAGRLGTPEEFRLALAAFLEHRAATRLAERAHRERTAAEAAFGEGRTADAETHALSAEVTYRAALEEWPACAEAADGLISLATLRVERALAAGETRAAARLLESHPEPPEALRASVEEAVKTAHAEDARLREIVNDADRGMGHRLRGIAGAVTGLSWLAFWSTMVLYPPDTVAPMVAFALGVLVVGSSAILLRGRALLANRINRTSMAVVVTTLLGTAAWCLGSSMLGLPIATTFAGLLLVWALGAAGMAILMDPFGGVSAVGFAVAFLVASWRPAWAGALIIGGNVLMLVNQLVLNFARAKRGFERMPSVGPSVSASDDRE